MRPYETLTERGQVQRLRRVARAALRRFGIDDGGRLPVSAHAENTTFVVRHAGQRYSMRVHRIGYHDERQIRSELAWLAALQRDMPFEVPDPVTALDGEPLVTIDAPGVLGARHCVLLKWIDGRSRADDPPPTWLETIGALTARLHRHADGWTPPPDFARPRWDAQSLVGPGSKWGSLLALDGLTPALRRRFGAFRDEISARLDAFGYGDDRFGLIHADLHAGNVLRRSDEAHVIDFDDCGYGWWVFDMAVTLAGHRTRDDFDALKTAWLRGYRRIRPLPDAQVALFETMCAARVIAITAWVQSRSDIPGIRAYAPKMVERMQREIERNG